VSRNNSLAHCRCRGNRAGAPAGLSPQAVSGKAARHIAQALHDYRGLLAFLFIFALILFS